jgi:hypothetical protein
MPSLAWLALLTLARLSPCSGNEPVENNKIKVTLVVILASEGNSDDVDPRLKWVAQEVRKKNPNLRCFKVKSMNRRSLAVEEKAVFRLVDDKTAQIVVKQTADKKNRVGVAVTAPDQGEIVYRTVCGKFLPIVTRYQTKARERLILAVCVRPCNGD